MKARLLGIGTAQPPNAILQRDAAELARSFTGPGAALAPLLPKLYDKTGVGQRHSVLLRTQPDGGVKQNFYCASSGAGDRGPTVAARMREYEQHAPQLAEAAARRALDCCSAPAEAVTHLITVSCTGFSAPGVDIALIDSLGLRPTVERINVGFMGCHGAINGLRCAASIAEAAPGALVLVCAVELCSLHYHYGDNPEQVVANALFADGAAAAAVSAAGGGLGGLAGFGSYLFPGSREAMSWRISDHSFVMSLSAALPALLERELQPWLAEWLALHDLQLNDVRNWAVHPGGPRILTAVRRAMELDDSDLAVSREVLYRSGNMSSPTVLFILERLLSERPGAPSLLLGFGPGVMAEAALLLPL